MTFTALIFVCALFSVLFLIASARRFRRRQLLAGTAHGATSVILILLCVCAALLGLNLRTYQRLTAEQPAGELQLTRTGEAPTKSCRWTLLVSPTCNTTSLISATANPSFCPLIT